MLRGEPRRKKTTAGRVPSGPSDGASQETTHAASHGHANIGQIGTNAIANANNRSKGLRGATCGRPGREARHGKHAGRSVVDAPGAVVYPRHERGAGGIGPLGESHKGNYPCLMEPSQYLLSAGVPARPDRAGRWGQ